MDPDSAVAIGIIVNELVINAVKYAYPDSSGPIDVQLRRDGDGIELAIADRGVGMQSTPSPGSTGMGQRIVEAMATKLDAKIVRDPSHSGTRMILRLGPKPQPKSAGKPGDKAASGKTA
jgi:two-component sensor histidine kinase